MNAPYLPPALRLLRPGEPLEQQLCFAEALWTPSEYARKAANLLELHDTARAVVYGAPGSGKSTFAALAGQGLADRGAPLVPLLFSMSSRRHPDDLPGFLTRRLTRAYPALRRTPVEDLVHSGRYLFLLDGLDEMPARMRRWALEEVDQLFGPDAPVVLLTGDTGLDEPLGLRGAQHIGIDPAGPDAVADYLDALGRLEHPNITGAVPGFDRLAKGVRTDPCGPLAVLLCRPLDLALAAQALRRGLLWPSDLTTSLTRTGLSGTRNLLRDLEIAGALNGRWPRHRTTTLARRLRVSDVGPRPGRFLTALHEAGLLRREGRLYDFRHTELRDHAAALALT
ncbi:NACHT domain-containing protein [Actinoplanes sp. TRM 88003]|uniref:NACHT domain-containing protein n=1 Tax=Paractinoplanes aksuensis TaxID=2939490 RepID=A0ABT1DHS3_9ACTN|nr:NACHT domain-containing protein [Actinoplanes aksuensis]MCO8270384.1 NACHT domain-containing protein [Actinoplanes aksuensis]